MIEDLLFHTPMIQLVIFSFTNHRDSLLMNVNVIMNSHIVEMFKTFFFYTSPVDTGRKLSVHKTFRRRPECLRNILCTFSLRPVSTGTGVAQKLKHY